MRMWMVDPHSMCTKHLSGEHVELHMVAGWLRRGRRVDGWVDTNCLEPLSIARRHAALAREMNRRGWDHRSPLIQPPVAAYQRPEATVDKTAALLELRRRCSACRKLQEMQGERHERGNQELRYNYLSGKKGPPKDEANQENAASNG